MAINWRQREPVLRVLAAVYAELGEDAFKGRYDRIARLYGNDASYSAIKSFFAKEIVKLAEDMKVRTANHRAESIEVTTGQRASVVRRPIHITFDDVDDEIVIVSERRAASELRNVRSTFSLEQVKPSLTSSRNEYMRTSQDHESLGMTAFNLEDPPPGIAETSSGTGKGKQNCEAGVRRSIQRRKRPYSAIEGSENLPLSYAYVTTQGQHRCALCMTELPTADMLRKHESLSELHLRNLKDPAIILRGQTTLAEHNSMSEHTSRKQYRPNPTLPNTTAFSRRDEATGRQNAECQEHSSTFHRRTGSNVAHHDTDTVLDTIDLAEPGASRMEVIVSNINRIADDDNAENGSSSDIEIVEQSAKSKGKEPVLIASNDQPAAVGVQAHPQTQNGSSLRQQQDRSTEVLQHSRHDSQSAPVPPTWIAQTLLSSGMELLAKKCIEEHPELKAGFYKCVQDMQAYRAFKSAEA